MTKQLEGKSIVLTGAGQGLGRAAAVAFSDHGARVAVLGRTRSKLEDTAKKMPGESLVLSVSLDDPDDVRKAFAAIGESWGGIDVLINNAAVYEIFKIEAATDKQIQDNINTNLAAPTYCIREAIPLLRANGGGHIVNVSTESVHHPIPYLTLYAGSKGGLEILTLGLKDELRPDNIRVTLLRLGGMNDPDKAPGSQFDPKIAREFHEAFVASGRDKMVGTLMELSTVTGAMVNLLALPADSSIDVMELRSK